MAQLVLGVAGAVVGSFFGMPQLGFAIGSMLGAGMAPAQKNYGPRLGDLKVTGTEYGQPIPYIEGHPGIAGQIWWASDRREISTTTSEGGKGGPTVETTTFSYEVDLLVGLTDNVIADVTRIWNNGKLIWSKLASLTYESPSGPATALTDAASIVASDTTDQWRRLTVYTGAADQLPDPTYEAAVGTANAPAYRGRGSVFIEGLQLGNSGQIPNLTFEVTTSSTDSGGAGTVGLIPSATWYARCGPMYAGADGLVMHVLSFTTPYTPLTVAIEQLGYDGTYQTLGAYSHTSAQPAGNFAGNLDEGGLLIFKTAPDTHEAFNASGVAVDIAPTDTTMGNFRWARRSGVIYLGGSGTAKVVYRFNSSGTITATSSALTSNTQSVAVTATSVYVLVVGSTSIQVLDPTTLVAGTPITTPTVTSANSLLLVNESDELFYAVSLAGIGYLYKYTGAAWTLLNSNLGNCAPSDQTPGTTLVDRFAVRGDTLYRASIPGSDTPPGATVYRSFASATLNNETLQNVVSRLCLRAGLSAGQIDVTALAAITKPVRALAVSQVSNTRVVLELLMSAYFFEAVLSDKLYFRPRGGASAVTIPYADLGASTDPNGAAEPLALRPANELEIPAQVALSYVNVDREYQTDTQLSDRLLSSASTVASVQMALGFNASEAKGIANAMVMDQVASWLTTAIAVLPTYSKYEPTDVVTVVAADGSTLRMRLVKKNDLGALLTFDAILDDATVLTNAGITMVDFVPSITVPAAIVSLMELLDIAILRDADNDVGFYAAVKGSGTPYAGAAILQSRDGVEFTEVATVTESAVTGVCTTALATWAGGNVFDEASSVTVDVALGTLASVTRDDMLDAGANACLIGSEIVQFRDASLVSPGVYTLKGLLRGRRGTEASMSGHASGERFVLLRATGLRRIEMQNVDIGALKYYRAVTLGRRLSTGVNDSLTLQSIGSKPFAPVDLRASRDVITGDISLTWSRRTRLSKNFSNGNVPLGETTEAYEVVVYTSGTFATVKRTITGLASATASYTSAQQVTDFGSNQATVFVRVYQISSIVGRGYPAQGSL